MASKNAITCNTLAGVGWSNAEYHPGSRSPSIWRTEIYFPMNFPMSGTDSVLQPITLIAGSAERIDKLVARAAKVNRAQAADVISLGGALIDGAVARKASERVSAESVVQIEAWAIERVQVKEEAGLQAEEMDICVIYEDDHLAVINKPYGLVVHPGNGIKSGTLASGLKHRFGKSLSKLHTDRPGIVHRLDKGTSGLMMIAKHDECHDLLASMLQRREVYKQYLAACYASPRLRSGTIQTQIQRHSHNREKMSVAYGDIGREAITKYRLQKVLYGGDACILEFVILTGRTHQIRLHAEHMGTSIIGDAAYGVRPPSFFYKMCPDLRAAIAKINRQLLHSTQLSFVHPMLGTSMNFTAEPPEDFVHFVAQSRLASGL